MTLTILLLIPLLASGICLIAPSRRWLELVTVLGAAVVLIFAGLAARQVMLAGHVGELANWLYADALSVLTLLVIAFVSFTTALYSVGYLREDTREQDVTRGEGLQHLRRYYILFNLFVFSMLVVPVSNSLGVLWIAIEGTTLASLFLVSFYRASGSFSYDALRAAAPMLSLPLRSAVFLLAFLGFGAKAGILPLQLWLPEAHPAAPSHISALLSAVIIKLGIYGMLRFLLDFLGGTSIAPAWWGLMILCIGALTALVGILYSVVQDDLKRVLAYSSIENIGIILAGLGAALTFRAYHLIALAAIAAIVTLYHVLNHAVYKGLLFLGAGSVQHATGTRELAKLGGLIRLMPWTALFFIVAALAISAVPPFNGYISEWMLLETLLQSFAIPDTLTKVVILVGIVFLALRALRPLGSRRVGPVWAGGIPRFAASMTYTGLAYSNPIRIIFNGLYRSRARSEAPVAAARHREGRITYQQEIPPPFERTLYQPLLSFWEGLTRRARFIQSGNVNQYVAYIFLIVLIVLILRAI